MADAKPAVWSAFSEREFYLREFRGRTLAIASAALPVPGALGSAVEELTGSGSRVVIIASGPDGFAGPWLEATQDCIETEVWRTLRTTPRVGVRLAPVAFLSATRELALRLGVFKLVLVDPGGGLLRDGVGRFAFLDLDELRRLLAQGAPGGGLVDRLPLLREIEKMLGEGVPAVNLCSAEGLSDELFTYAGSGTLFTRERYVNVRALGIDDFDAASDLMARGVEEGFLVARSGPGLDRVLANGFGAFVEGRYLAGIGALLRHPQGDSAEIASLYALTRFLGEGIGSHLVRFALEHARRLGLARVFACTTSERAQSFFERQGFRPVSHRELPSDKWRDYDPERLGRLRCLRCDVG
jgi:N-acetylglutamate synthase-like GNAT family acetyltransferase